MEIGIVVLIITGLVEVLKKSVPDINSYVLAILPIALGVLSGVLFVDAEIGVQLFSGIAIGLASMGVFDITKLAKTSK